MSICPACGSVHEEDGDCTPSRQFDDLTLWNKTLTQGEIRALNYLDRGLNGIVVPRGLFFQSQFFSNLNTTTFSQSSPVVGSTVMGNDNPGELHSRTIQQLIAANLTLAAAWTWIQELMTANDTGNVTSFPLVVTDEVYTLGFDQMVLNVLPNMTVENSGNSSEPPPPIREPTFWESAWNSFTGLLSAAWNAVVAVATFIANVALAVIKWCIDFAVAIANGEGLTFFYNTVVKPFVDAILAFIKWIIDLALAFVRSMILPLVSGLRAGFMSCVLEVASALDSALKESRNGGVGEGAKRAFAGAILGSLFAALVLTSVTLVVLLAALGMILLPLAFLIGVVLALAVPLILLAIVGGGEIRFGSLDVPPGLSLDPPSFYDDARARAFSGSTSDAEREMWDTLATLFDFLASMFAVLFMAANLDVTGLGTIAFGLTASIFSSALVLSVKTAAPGVVSNLAELGIGIASLALAVGGIAISIVGYIRALKIPGAAISLSGVLGLSLGCSAVAAWYSYEALK